MLDRNNFDKEMSQSAAYNSQVPKAENIPSSQNQSPYNSAHAAVSKKVSAGSPKKVNSIKIKNKLNKRKDNSEDGNSSSSDETDEQVEPNTKKNQKSMKFKPNALQQHKDEEEKKIDDDKHPHRPSDVEENKEEMESSGSKTSNFNSSHLRIN